jgi:hypothetical protein
MTTFFKRIDTVFLKVNDYDEGDVKWFRFKDLEGNNLEVCHFKE